MRTTAAGATQPLLKSPSGLFCHQGGRVPLGSGGCGGLRSGSPARSPSRSVRGSPSAATRPCASSRRSSRWRRTPSEPDEHADPTTGCAGRSPPPTAPVRNGGSGTAANRSCNNLLRLRTRSHLVLLALCLGRGRLAWRPTHPPSGPAVQTPQMELGQGCCLRMSGVDRELEQGARSGGVPPPPPPLIQQTELNGRQRGGTPMARLDYPLVDRCRTITVAPALTHRRQRKRRRRIKLWLLEALLPGGLGVAVIAAAGQQLPKGGGGLEGEARMVGVDRLLVYSPGLIDIAVALMEAAKQQRCPWRPGRILRIDRLPVGSLGPGKVPLLGIVGGQAQGPLGGDLPAARDGRLLEEPDLLGVLLTGKQ